MQNFNDSSADFTGSDVTEGEIHSEAFGLNHVEAENGFRDCMEKKKVCQIEKYGTAKPNPNVVGNAFVTEDNQRVELNFSINKILGHDSVDLKGVYTAIFLF